MFSGPDCGDMLGSPVGIMDVQDQLLSTEGFTSFDSFNQPPPLVHDEIFGNNRVAINNTSSSLVSYPRASSASEFDHIIKAEAMMTFAPEFGAVEAVTSELSSSIFKSPYLPKSRKAETSSSSSNNYVYGATPPPSSPGLDGADEKNGVVINSKTGTVKQTSIVTTLQAKNYYTVVESAKKDHSRSPNSSIITSDGLSTTKSNSSNIIKACQKKAGDGTFDANNLSLSMKTVLATELECIAFQASMCKIRHTLLSSSGPLPAGLPRLNPSSGTSRHPSDPSVMTDIKYEVKKKETIPVRIAGDIDTGMLDSHMNAPVGVWRTVSVPKISRPQNPQNMDASPSLPHNAFNEESMLSYGQRQPLQEFLDGIPLLVQQATSLVDLALDSDCGHGPFSLLALQEQWRKAFSCGPSMAHAGCGGALASCHSLDIAGVELIDPLSADVSAVF